MSENNATLRVSGVTKRSGDFTAVEYLSFDVRSSRVFGFMGQGDFCLNVVNSGTKDLGSNVF
jgi:ABC-type transporter Mla maintaining outer membrane lipid asymmetry ATPase subunit MlaF